MALATLNLSLTVVATDGTVVTVYNPPPITWTPGVGNGDRRVYSIATITFQALVIPTGSRYAIIIPQAGAVSLVLKGVTGDTGTTARPASSPIDGPILVTLGATPSLGILNSAGSTQTVEVLMV